MIQSPLSAYGAGPVEDVVGKYTSILRTKVEETPGKGRAISKRQYCLLDDLTVSQIEDGLLRELRKNIEKLDLAGLQRLNFDQVTGLNTVKEKPERVIGGIAEFSWLKKEKSTLSSRLKNFSKVEFTELKVIDYLVNPKDDRQGQNRFAKVNLKVRLDVRGRNKSDQLMQDRLELAMTVGGQSDWKIEKSEVLKAATLVQNALPAFEDVTAVTGLDKVSVNLRTEALRRGGYALAVTDYNDDGVSDIFVGHRENAEMFIGSKDGKFTKVSTPLDGEKYSKTAVFADFNNDGKRDAIINRFLQPETNGKKHNGPTPVHVAYYKSVDGKLVEQPNHFGSASSSRQPMPSAVADFDGDGMNDMYIGYPGVQDFSQFGEPEKSLKKFQGLYINDGKGGFVDNTEALNFNRGMAAYDSHLFPHSSLAVDLNQDHKMDLVVMDDRGHLSPAFINLGNGQFKESSKAIGISNYSYAMGVSAGDINNDGLVDIAMTNVNFNEVNRVDRYCEKHRALKLSDYDTNGLRIFSAKSAGAFSEVASDIFVDAGEAMGGLTFIDYNNDGMLDLYVVNGLWSGTRNGQDLGSFFASAMTISKNHPYYSLAETNGLRFMDVLQKFSGRIGDYTDSGTIKAGAEKPSLAGYQRNRLYRNNGDGTFTDVAFLEGVDSIADGYVVGKMDYNRDGQMDLVLRNADPGTKEHQFPAVQLFKNRNSNPEKSLVLTFEGTKLTREALGLFVKAYAKDWQQVAHLEGNSGSMQQEHVIHFGLGNNKKLDKLEIYWPSGVKQTIKDVKPGFLKIVEPTGEGKISLLEK